MARVSGAERGSLSVHVAGRALRNLVGRVHASPLVRWRFCRRRPTGW